MLKALSKLFDGNQKILNRYEKIVESINAYEDEYTKLSNEDISAKSEEFKLRLKRDETLDDILPEAFALVKEAASRTLGMRHYDVQLIAGIAFHEGKVAEQRTGEGKTLSATLPLYLNALTEKGAHLVTVNDYLAQRDAGWNAPMFHLLGLSVGVIFSGEGNLPASIYDPEYNDANQADPRLRRLKPVSRKEAYEADITYGTNNEFGFDYLRDNMAQSLDRMSQRGHHYAIVDEVDSILIDEARTPLIISAPDTEPTKKYYEFAKLVTTLQKGTDYALDEKLRTVTLTDYGLRRLEKRLGVSNLYEDDYDAIHHVESALKAQTLFTRDKDYVVKDGQVIIVDEHTGRLMFGRRYSKGLHQAIEAKENVQIQQESRTLATISLQNYFRMYEKLAGMTGTASTEADEFTTIYDMEVVVIPTNKPVVRQDHPDMVFKTRRAKFGAIVKEVREKYEAGQPVLIGTKSIEQNDIMSRYLKRMKIPHQVLNAKNHMNEAMIIAEAGKPGAVTVATNIAGRGVDIVLGGSLPEEPAEDAPKKEKEAYETTYADWRDRHEQVLKAGGLAVIGADRHDSRRIDNQLRGRSGRQGDPGMSRFYVSLEDDLMRIFGGERVAKIMDALKIPEDQPIESGMVSKSIEQAQTKVEGFHFDQRKRVVEYDDVMNKQREIIYKRRYAMLSQVDEDGKPMGARDKMLAALDDEVQTIVISRSAEGLTEAEYDAILKEFMSIIPFDAASQQQIMKQMTAHDNPEKVVEELQKITHRAYDKREEMLGDDAMRQVEQFATLSSIDSMWMDHLDAMDDLRGGIWLRGGKDQVLSEYKKEAFDMFEKLLATIDSEMARQVFRIGLRQTAQPIVPVDQATAGKDEDFDPSMQQPKAAPAASTAPVSTGTGSFAAALAKTAQRSGSDSGRTPVIVDPKTLGNKVGRNDPCPCGSGKKWKKCGMINAPGHKA